ncbi:MAG: SIMPL domain-containing protein [Actinomycetota bacterium]|nr:SIMPL domain-containing protein [Actinomycetota bacterium]
MDISTVTVRGQAVVPGEPDEVRLAVEVTALFPTPEEALDDVTRRSEILERVFENLNIPQPARTTSGVSVREEREYERGKYLHLGYTASNSISIRLNDPQLVGRLIKEATNQAQARLQGSWWQIAFENPARVEAYRQAAGDARRKAEAYAQALGARLGAVLTVTEPGLRREPAHDSVFAMASASDMAPGSESEIDVHAGSLISAPGGSDFSPRTGLTKVIGVDLDNGF